MKKRVLIFVQTSWLLLVAVMLFAQCRPEPQNAQGLNNCINGQGCINQQNGNGQGQGQNQTCDCIMNQFPSEALSVAETDALLKMREEEKLARDVYQYLYAQWQVQAFQNISQSEQRHMDAIGCLIQKYNLTDPVGNHAAGVFTDPALQTLYNDLIATGAQSLTAALTVGATIEDLDIDDLMDLSENDVDNADILAVFDQLTRGSRNHIRAFTQLLEQDGETYIPQYISADLYAEILNTPHEKGGGLCGKKGKGKGKNG